MLQAPADDPRPCVCQRPAMGVVKIFMPAYIVLTVLFAALLHALWNIIVKGGENKLFETGLNALGAGLGAACIVPFLPPLDPACLPYLGMSCICHFTYYICIAEAYKKVDLTFGYTIMRGSAPLLTSLAMLFFGESLSLGAWCGVLTLCCGVFCLAKDNARRARTEMPFSSRCARLLSSWATPWRTAWARRTVAAP